MFATTYLTKEFILPESIYVIHSSSPKTSRNNYTNIVAALLWNTVATYYSHFSDVGIITISE